jgi:hypothetical protein
MELSSITVLTVNLSQAEDALLWQTNARMALNSQLCDVGR